MFDENYMNTSSRKGWIEVVVGSMFSGKTEELIRRLRRAQLANQKVMIFKNALDTRYSQTELVSHDEKSIHSIPVSTAKEILAHISDVNVVGIDEGQFFGQDLPEIANYLANSGIRVIVAGLDMDYQGKPFGLIPQLMAIAEYVTKLHAVCVRCGNLASYSHRKINVDDLVLLGELKEYEPLCRDCYDTVTN